MPDEPGVLPPRARRWPPIAETLAILAVCMGTIVIVGVGLLWSLAPRTFEVRFALVPSGDRPALEPTELVAAVMALGRTDQVTVVQREDRDELKLAGLDTTEGVEERVSRLLVEAGYVSTPATILAWPDGERFLSEHARLLIGVQSAILLACGGAAIALRVRRAAPDKRARLPAALLVGCATGLAAFLCSAGIGWLQKLLGWEVEEQAWLTTLLNDREALPTLLPWLVLVAPLAEEVFFRGYVFRFLDQQSTSRAAYLVSAATFSMIHLHLPGLLVYFAVGLLFAWSARRTARMAAPIAAHVTYNGTALALTLVLQR